MPNLLILPEAIKVLVVAPHPDDEVFGCGGTLALLARNHCRVRVVLVTDGRKGDPNRYHEGDIAARRREESRSALALLGVTDIVFLDEPDGDFRETPGFSKTMHGLCEDYAADWLFIPSPSEYHRDHVGIGLALLKYWIERGCVERAFCYEVWGSLPATWIVDIGSVMDDKLAAVRQHKLPLSYINYLDATVGLALYRGAQLTRADERRYAEAYLEIPRGFPGFCLAMRLWLARRFSERLISGGA